MQSVRYRLLRYALLPLSSLVSLLILSALAVGEQADEAASGFKPPLGAYNLQRPPTSLPPESTPELSAEQLAEIEQL